MYTIVWKYTVKPDTQKIFEKEYGAHGVWSIFFKGSKNYRGSHLHQDDANPLSYLLIDIWTDKVSYENFKRINATDYLNQSDKLEYLYEKEELIGCYTSIKV
jgi:hypothetical protein